MISPLPIANRGEIACSFLPELVSGRGTSRRSRMVEGQACHRLLDDISNNAVEVRQNVTGWNSQRRDAGADQPLVTRHIATGPAAARVGFAIDLDRQPCVATKKIENERTGWMLAAEFDSAGSLLEFAPQQSFGKGQRFSEPSRLAERAARGRWRNVFQHSLTPPPCFAWSPSPRQAREGICR